MKPGANCARRPADGSPGMAVGRQVQLAAVGMLVALILVVAAHAASVPAIERHVLGGGGGFAEVEPYALHATLGQAVAGVDGDGLCAGFWCRGAGNTYGLYLPLVTHNS